MTFNANDWKHRIIAKYCVWRVFSLQCSSAQGFFYYNIMPESICVLHSRVNDLYSNIYTAPTVLVYSNLPLNQLNGNWLIELGH